MLFSLQSLTGDPPGTPCESKHAAAARAIGMSDVDVRACLAHPHALGTIMHTSAAEAMRCGAAGVAHDVSLYSEPDAFGFETSALPGEKLVVYHGTEDYNVPFSHGQYWHDHAAGSRLFVAKGEGHMSGLTSDAVRPALREFLR